MNSTIDKRISAGELKRMLKQTEALIQEGRNQVLYLLLALGDENVAHDNWHPERANILVESRRTIVQRLKHKNYWPEKWPDFEAYTYSPG